MPVITPNIKTRLWEYLGGIVKGAGGIPIQLGGMDDHVHLLVTLRQEQSVMSFMRDLKAASSGWIHDTFPEAKDLWWQKGYGAFTVSHSGVGEVKKYIADQEEHHKAMSFRMSSVCISSGTGSRSTRNTCGSDASVAAPRLRSFSGVPRTRSSLAKPRSTPGYHRSSLRDYASVAPRRHAIRRTRPHAWSRSII